MPIARRLAAAISGIGGDVWLDERRLQPGDRWEQDILSSVRRGVREQLKAGADFIKTSTGKVVPAATPPVTLVMLEAIRDFYIETGKRIARTMIEASGGVA